LTAVPTITPAERQILMEAARALNQYQEPAPVRATAKSQRKNTGVLLPGDDFNARASWHEVLTPHGWTFVGSYGEEERWCRPGKDGCVSATTNHNGSGLLHVFTSNAPCLDADRGYSKFSAYAFLNHRGDFKAAARDLEEQGYGTPRLQAGRR
jgi:putative DNA primase/helicase